MSKKQILWICGPVISLITLFVVLDRKPPSNSSPTPRPRFEPIPESPFESEVGDEEPTFTSAEASIDSIQNPRLLRNYGSDETSVEDDLALVNNVLQRFGLLFKNPDLLQVGSNEEILKSLTGSNPDGICFISPENAFIDDKGRLTDRWGTPLFFHPESLTRIEIRSAGPDQTLFTDDDAVSSPPSKVPLH